MNQLIRKKKMETKEIDNVFVKARKYKNKKKKIVGNLDYVSV